MCATDLLTSLFALLLEPLRSSLLIFIHSFNFIGFLLLSQQVIVNLEDTHRRKRGANQQSVSRTTQIQQT
jgi:hypothetical protein